MRRLLWLGAWLAVAFWSLAAFLAYGALDAVGHLAMRNADAFSSDPETVEWVFRVFGWLRGLSTSIALVVWGVVSLVILAVPWLLDRVIGRSVVVQRQSVRYTTSGARGAGAAARDGVIDLSPDQYTVQPHPGRPAGTGPATGSVPRVPPVR